VEVAVYYSSREKVCKGGKGDVPETNQKAFKMQSKPYRTWVVGVSTTGAAHLTMDLFEYLFIFKDTDLLLYFCF